MKQRLGLGGKKESRSTTIAPSLSSNNSLTRKVKGRRVVDKLIEKDYLRQKKVIIFVVYGIKSILVIVLAILFIFLIYRHYVPSGQEKSNGKISFKVVQGQGVREIAQNLSEDNIIDSKIYFLIYARYKNKPLLVGDYNFKQHQNIKDTYAKLVQGTINDVKITIPEGWRREQIGQLLDQKKITSYEAFMEASDGKEGQLFPDTYLLPKPTTASIIIKKMTDNYNLRTKDLSISQNDLTLASIVEREAKHDSDRPKVASVFDNRLVIEMKLQSDVTVGYAVDSSNLDNVTSSQIDSYKFWQGISASQIKSVVSSYNTYQASGLPPGPICNPGIKSLMAVKNPDKTDYLYFLSTDNGPVYYAKTLAEHNQNIQKYSRS